MKISQKIIFFVIIRAGFLPNLLNKFLRSQEFKLHNLAQENVSMKCQKGTLNCETYTRIVKSIRNYEFSLNCPIGRFSL